MDRFIKFFTAEDEEDEEYDEFDEVDPIVEARRKEKFSAPLIYDDEVEEYKEEPKTSKNSNFVLEPKKHKAEKQNSDYVPREIISPISGVERHYDTSTNDDTDEPIVIPTLKKSKPSPKMTRVVSPFYGLEDTEDDEEVKEEVKQEVKQVKVEEPVKESVEDNQKVIDKLFENEYIDENKVKERQKELEEEFSTGQVTQSIRNLSQMIAEEEENMKIIEGKTGEFKLKLDEVDDSLIDNVEDTMSLDDLMSLYEKKFKD